MTDIFPHSEDMCSICDCSANPSTLQQDRVISHPSKSLLPAFLQSTILNVQCLHIYAKDPVALGMLRRTSQTPDKMFQWDVSRLQPSLPTSFVFTKTSPTGKTGTLRPGYIQRHVHTMLKHESLVAANRTYFDGVASSDRQLIWIIVEDGLVVDEEVAAVLAKSRLNYIYWAYGPTRSYGNAQHNAALSMVHALTENYLGHGPILGVDDDAEIHPDLLQLIWKVKRVGLWPMGNLVGLNLIAESAWLIFDRARADGRRQSWTSKARSRSGRLATLCVSLRANKLSHLLVSGESTPWTTAPLPSTPPCLVQQLCQDLRSGLQTSSVFSFSSKISAKRRIQRW